jgi:hypothetical protein
MESLITDALLRALIQTHPDRDALRERFEREVARVWTAMALEQQGKSEEAVTLAKEQLTGALEKWRLSLS